jgi:hypothetical protein
MFECRIEEEAVVLDLEVLALFADSALAQGDELLALGERADGDRPFLESDWHRKKGRRGTDVRDPERRTRRTPPRPRDERHSRKGDRKSQMFLL